MIYGKSYEGSASECGACGHFTNVHTSCAHCNAACCENCEYGSGNKHYCSPECEQAECERRISVTRKNEMPAVAEHVKNLGWKLEVNYGGQKSCRCPDDDEYSVALHEDYWELCRFTDSDIGDVAVGRFEGFEEGDTVRELILALRKLRPEPAAPPRKAPAVAASGNAPAARETGS